jgi:hypothetical protein
MNVFHLPEFAMNVLNGGWNKICKRHGGIISVGTVHWPNYMSTQVLPKDVKDRIVEHWSTFNELKQHAYWTDRVLPQLDFMNSSNQSNLFPALVDYIDTLDAIRPVKFSEVYGDYYKLLTE